MQILEPNYATIAVTHITLLLQAAILYLLFTLIKTKLKEQTNERFGLGIASAAWARQHSYLTGTGLSL